MSFGITVFDHNGDVVETTDTLSFVVHEVVLNYSQLPYSATVPQCNYAFCTALGNGQAYPVTLSGSTSVSVPTPSTGGFYATACMLFCVR